jgi:glycosyltransferase involved in cell wall biosynthesis
MSAGKAIVASNTGEIPRTIRNLENGVLCEPNPRSYAEAIRSLILNPSLVDRLAKAARQTAIEKFSWEFIGSIWLSLCESCIHSKGS